MGVLSLCSISFAEEVQFDRDIQPILANRCFKCHGRSEVDRKAKLRLDQFESAKRVLLKSATKESELLARVKSSDPNLRMPPPETGPPLTSGEIEKLEAWIQRGATYTQHWAFIPPKKPSLPEVRDLTWSQNPIDRFVLARLEKKGIVPSPPASRRTLLRRLSFDLRGLPPSPEEVHTFVQNSDPASTQKVIERYLNSHQFGEKQAQVWLDLARYADTTGHAADKPRSMWLYRDWVISALNENLPFDQFTLQQIAGDLLPNASVSQKVATGFHRNSMQALGNNPRKEEFRIKGIVDRLDTTGKTWLGLTVSCSECHDHKYDPLSQEEYYQLFAIFNNVPHYGQKFGVRGPQLKVLSLEQREEWDRQEALIARAQSELNSLKLSGNSSAESKWLEDPFSYFESKHEWKYRFAVRGEGDRFSQDTPWGKGNSLQFEGDPESVQPISIKPGGEASFTLSVWIKTRSKLADIVSNYDWRGKQRGFVLGIGGQRDPGYRAGHPYVWLSATPNPFSGIEIEGSKRIDDGKWHHLAFIFEPGKKAQLYIDGKLDLKSRVKGTIPARLAQPNRPWILGGGYSNSPSPNSYFLRGKVHDLRLYSSVIPNVNQLGAVSPELRRAIIVDERERTQQQRELLRSFSFNLSSKSKRLTEQIQRAKEKQDKLQKKAHTAQVMEELEEPRETHIHVRGDFEVKGKRVQPGLPQFISIPESKKNPNRLDFAKWLTHPEHPLMARVTVNRIWAQYFGQGIVRTLDDFGTRGDVPSHPKLLDWLALELIESAWDVKRIHRLIVSSTTYQQSSVLRKDLQTLDPDNRWLAQFSRRRMTAEQIRDLALSVGGLLSLKYGGPSVYPHQPQGIGEFRDATAGKWKMSHGEDRYRRSLYTFWQRMSPYPSLVAFDAPSRERSCAQRSTTNTPLQALALLNDPIFVEAAESCAQRIINKFSEPEDRIRFAFSLILSREPDREELDYSLKFLKRWSGNNKNSSLKIWRSLCQVLLNLDEAITSE